MQDKTSVKGIEQTDTCKGTDLTYQLYIPGSASRCKDLPLLIVIDPHANGKLAISKFRKAADRFSCIIIASNTIKNNSPDYISDINYILEEAKARYPIGKNLFIAGFSGGARMAVNYARYYPVDGVISCGALAPDDQLKNISSRVFCIVGYADFNFIEAAQFIFNPEKAPANLYLDFTEDIHQWPDEKSLEEALGILLLHLKNEKICASGELNYFSKSLLSGYDSLISHNKWIEAVLLARNLSKTGNTRFNQYITNLEKNADLNKELNHLRESIRFELAVHNAYYTALRDEDLEWWKKEIGSLLNGIETEKDIYKNYALRRIKGFVGIVCYSLVNSNLRQNKMEDTEKLLGIYRLIEPENPDMLYFTAVYEYKLSHSDKAREFLEKAFEAGFSDTTLMVSDFPENYYIDKAPKDSF